MWHSWGNRLDAADTPVSCALSDGSSERLLGTAGIPRWRNHNATGGPERGQKRDLILQIGTNCSPIFQIKHSTRETNSNLSFFPSKKTLRCLSWLYWQCRISKIRTSHIQSEHIHILRALSNKIQLYVFFLITGYVIFQNNYFNS